MQLFFCPELLEGNTYLNAEESKHCTKVLRKKKGDLINITDGNGHIYECVLDEVNSGKCSFHIETKKSTAPPGFSIHIAISPTKSADRIEWFVEKAVEIGIQEISFIQSTHSERKHVNLERVQKKAVSAMKQSGRTRLPQLHAMTKLSSFIKSNEAQEMFVAHLEDSDTPHLLDLAGPGKSYLVIVGPEGGFSPEEIIALKDQSFQVAKIGNFRLRTETAGIAVCSILNNINHTK